MMSDEPDMLRQAFDAGFNAHLSFSAQSSSSSSEQTIDGNNIAITSATGLSELTIDIADGGLTGTTSTEAGRISGVTPAALACLQVHLKKLGHLQ